MKITNAYALRLQRFVRGLPPTPAISCGKSLAPTPCGFSASFVGYRPHPLLAQKVRSDSLGKTRALRALVVAPYGRS